MELIEQLQPSNEEREEEKGDQAGSLCKICLEDVDGSPLLHGVCDCKGSLDGVHGRCLIQWQLKRTSKPWICEICHSKIQWPANETLTLVELLSELSEKSPPPTTRLPRSQLARAGERRQASNPGPSKWRLLQQAMSTRCKSIFLPGGRQRRGGDSAPSNGTSSE